LDRHAGAGTRRVVSGRGGAAFPVGLGRDLGQLSITFDELEVAATLDLGEGEGGVAPELIGAGLVMQTTVPPTSASTREEG
jgi:hypothetical protein